MASKMKLLEVTLLLCLSGEGRKKREVSLSKITFIGSGLVV